MGVHFFLDMAQNYVEANKIFRPYIMFLIETVSRGTLIRIYDLKKRLRKLFLIGNLRGDK